MSPLSATDLLYGLVAIPSVSGFERPAAEFLRDQGAALGLVSTIDEAGNVVAATSGDPLRTAPGTSDIVLLGHTDTVPGFPPVRIDHGRLYGRGSVDAKGPLAAFFAAAAVASLPAGVRIVVIGAVEEESASSRGARAVLHRYAPAACIIGEPSGWDGVTIGYKGRLLTRFVFQKACCHTAGPDGSVADACFKWWGSVESDSQSLVQANASPFESVQASLRAIRTDSDGLADRVETLAAFRLPPGVSPSQIENIARAHANGADVSFSGQEVAVLGDRASPVVRALTAAIRASGKKPRLVKKTGTSDMNVVGPVWNCPIAAYGPGDSALDHTPDEHILIDEYHKSIEVVAQALESIAHEFAKSPTPAVRS